MHHLKNGACGHFDVHSKAETGVPGLGSQKRRASQTSQNLSNLTGQTLSFLGPKQALLNKSRKLTLTEAEELLSFFEPSGVRRLLGYGDVQ
jgi:hypothetical protein